LDDDPGVGTVVDFLERYRAHALDEIRRVSRFARELPREVELIIAPEIRIGVRDLKALAHLAEILAGRGVPLERLEKVSSAAPAT
jgi:hypothetical protein